MQISVQIGLNWNWPTGTELGKNGQSMTAYDPKFFVVVTSFNMKISIF